ncbi:MAG: uracil-DNA glycosylase, partial [Gammaproteobacteria bacterium]|nr:uracil-DNA glycosylase [Gammaproteobacteria bacterium]
DVWRERGALPERAAAASPDFLAAEPGVAIPSVADVAADAAPTSEMGWDALRAAVSGCRQCGLCETRTNTVFGVGAETSEWMVIGEAPGANEDAQGEPFVGRAGKLLNSMLEAIGLARDSVFISNTLKCRPAGNRDPSPEETKACSPYLIRQIELLRPKIILAVGRIAAQTLLESTESLGKLRGREHRYAPTATPLIVTYHPAYLLRTPAHKRQAWEDLKRARGLVNRQ